MLNYLFYVLEASVFKKNPVARVYIDDILVDEHDVINSNFTIPLSEHSNLNIASLRVIKFHTKYKNLDVKIKISNQDSNHTNGFMTKSTLVNLSRLYVITENILRQIENIRKKFKHLQSENIDKMILENFAQRIDLNFLSCRVAKEDARLIHTYSPGGDGEYHLQLRKKLGFWLRKHDKNFGIRYLGHDRDLELLVTKYRSNENK